MKKIVAVVMFTCLFFASFVNVGHASVPPKLFLDGKRLYSDVEPTIIKGSTLVPLAILTEGLGYEVEWEGDLKRVTVKSNDTLIQLIINDSTVMVNGEPQVMNAVPQLIQWRTMVPVRFIGELLGLEFEWKDAEREVHMFSHKDPETDPDPDPDPSDNGSQPIVPTGYVESVDFDQASTLNITYSGEVKPSKPFYLSNPRRLVIDLPGTSYTGNHFSEVQVEDNPFIDSYRHSAFSSDPLIARVVIDLKDDIGHVMTQSDGQITIQLMPVSEVPEEPTTDPVDPTPTPTPTPTPEPSDPGEGKIYHVVLDAGHGGTDSGAVSKDKKKLEKDFTYTVVNKMKAILEKDPRVQVHLSRPDDVKIELRDRVAFAEKVKADVFVSVHVNSFTKDTATGSETYYYRDNSKELANIMQKHLVAGTGLANRGVKTAPFVVIKETTMPAVLVETGYISNPNDLEVLYNDKNQDRIAAELVLGIKEFLKLN